MTWFGLKFVQITRMICLIVLQLTLSALKYMFKACRFLLADILAVLRFRYLKRTYDIEAWRHGVEKARRKEGDCEVAGGDNEKVADYVNLIYAKWRGNKDFWLFQGHLIPTTLRRKYHLPPLPKWYNNQEPRDFFDTVPYMSRLFAYFAVAWRTDLTITWFEIIPAFSINARVPGMYETLLWYFGALYWIWRIFIAPYIWFVLILFIRPFFYWDLVFFVWHIPFVITKSLWVSVYSILWYVFWITSWSGLLVFSKFVGTFGILVPWNNYYLTYKVITSYSRPRYLRWNFNSRLGRLWIFIWFKLQMFKMNFESFLEPQTTPEKEARLLRFFFVGSLLYGVFRHISKELLLMVCYLGVTTVSISFQLFLMLLQELFIIQLIFKQLRKAFPSVVKLLLALAFRVIVRTLLTLFFVVCEICFMYASSFLFSVRLVVELLWTPFRGALAFCWLFFFMVIKLPIMLIRFCTILVFNLFKKIINFFKVVGSAWTIIIKVYYTSFLRYSYSPASGNLTRIKRILRLRPLVLGKYLLDIFRNFFLENRQEAFTRIRGPVSYVGSLIKSFTVCTDSNLFSKVFTWHSSTAVLANPFWMVALVTIFKTGFGFLYIIHNTIQAYFTSKFSCSILAVKFVQKVAARLLHFFFQGALYTFKVFESFLTNLVVHFLALTTHSIKFLFCTGWRSTTFLLHLILGLVQWHVTQICMFLANLFRLLDVICHKIVVRIDQLCSFLWKTLVISIKGLVACIRGFVVKTTRLIQGFLYKGRSAYYLNPVVIFSFLTSLFTQLVVRLFIWIIFCPTLLIIKIAVCLCNMVILFYKILFIKATNLLCMLSFFLKTLLVEIFRVCLYTLPLFFVNLTGCFIKACWLKASGLHSLSPFRKIRRSLPYTLYFMKTKGCINMLSYLIRALTFPLALSRCVFTTTLLFFLDLVILIPQIVLPPLAITNFRTLLIGVLCKVSTVFLELCSYATDILYLIFQYLQIPAVVGVLKSGLILCIAWLKTLVFNLLSLLGFMIKIYLTISCLVFTGYFMSIYVSILFPYVFSLYTLLLGYWIVTMACYVISRTLTMLVGLGLANFERVIGVAYRRLTCLYESTFNFTALLFSQLLTLLFLGPWMLYIFLLKVLIYTILVYWRSLLVFLVTIPMLFLVSASLGVLVVLKWLVILSFGGVQLLLLSLMKTVFVLYDLVYFILTCCQLYYIKLVDTLQNTTNIETFYNTLLLLLQQHKNGGINYYYIFSDFSWLLYEKAGCKLTAVTLWYKRCASRPQVYCCLVFASLFTIIFYSVICIKILSSYIYTVLSSYVRTLKECVWLVYALLVLNTSLSSVSPGSGFISVNTYSKLLIVLNEMYNVVLRTGQLLMSWFNLLLCFFIGVFDLPFKCLVLVGLLLDVILRSLATVGFRCLRFLFSVLILLVKWVRLSLEIPFHLIAVLRGYFYASCRGLESLSFILYTKRVWLVNYVMLSLFVLCKISFRWGAALLWRLPDYLKSRGLLFKLSIWFYLPNKRRRPLVSVFFYTCMSILWGSFALVGFIGVHTVTPIWQVLIYLFVYLPNVVLVALQAALILLSELPVILTFYIYILIMSGPSYLYLTLCNWLQLLVEGPFIRVKLKEAVLLRGASWFVYYSFQVFTWPLKVWHNSIQGVIRTMAIVKAHAKALALGVIDTIAIGNLKFFKFSLKLINTLKLETFRGFVMGCYKYRLIRYLVKAQLSLIQITLSLIRTYCSEGFNNIRDRFRVSMPTYQWFDRNFYRSEYTQMNKPSRALCGFTSGHYILLIKSTNLYKRALGVRASSFISNVLRILRKLVFFRTNVDLGNSSPSPFKSFCVQVCINTKLLLNKRLCSYNKFISFVVFYLVDVVLKSSIKTYFLINVYFKRPLAAKGSEALANKQRVYSMGFLENSFESRTWRLAVKALTQSGKFIPNLVIFLINNYYKLSFFLCRKIQDISTSLKESASLPVTLVRYKICTLSGYIFKKCRGLINLSVVFLEILNLGWENAFISVEIRVQHLFLVFFWRRLINIIELSRLFVFNIIFLHSSAGLLLSIVVKTINLIDHWLGIVEFTRSVLECEMHKIKFKIQESRLLIAKWGGSTYANSHQGPSSIFLTGSNTKNFAIHVLVCLRSFILTVLRVLKQLAYLVQLAYNFMIGYMLLKSSSYLSNQGSNLYAQGARLVNQIMLWKSFGPPKQSILSNLNFGLLLYLKKLIKPLLSTVYANTFYIFIRKAHYKIKRRPDHLEDMETTRKKFFKDESRDDLFLDTIFYLSLAIRSIVATFLLECFTVGYAYITCRRFLYGKLCPKATDILEDLHGSWVSFEIVLEDYIQRKFKSDFQYPETLWWAGASERAHKRTEFTSAVLSIWDRFLYWLVRVIFNCVTLYPVYVLKLLVTGLFFKTFGGIILSPFYGIQSAKARFVVTIYKTFSSRESKRTAPFARRLAYILIKHLLVKGPFKVILISIDLIICLINAVFAYLIIYVRQCNYNISGITTDATKHLVKLRRKRLGSDFFSALAGVYGLTLRMKWFGCQTLVTLLDYKVNTITAILIVPLVALQRLIVRIDTKIIALANDVGAIGFFFFGSERDVMPHWACSVVDCLWEAMVRIYSIHVVMTRLLLRILWFLQRFNALISKPIFSLMVWVTAIYSEILDWIIDYGLLEFRRTRKKNYFKSINVRAFIKFMVSAVTNQLLRAARAVVVLQYMSVSVIINNVCCIILDLVAAWINTLKILIEQLNHLKVQPGTPSWLLRGKIPFISILWHYMVAMVFKAYQSRSCLANSANFYVLNLINLIKASRYCLYLLAVIVHVGTTYALSLSSQTFKDFNYGIGGNLQSKSSRGLLYTSPFFIRLFGVLTYTSIKVFFKRLPLVTLNGFLDILSLTILKTSFTLDYFLNNSKVYLFNFGSIAGLDTGPGARRVVGFLNSLLYRLLRTLSTSLEVKNRKLALALEYTHKRFVESCDSRFQYNSRQDSLFPGDFSQVPTPFTEEEVHHFLLVTLAIILRWFTTFYTYVFWPLIRFFSGLLSVFLYLKTLVHPIVAAVSVLLEECLWNYKYKGPSLEQHVYTFCCFCAYVLIECPAFLQAYYQAYKRNLVCIQGRRLAEFLPVLKIADKFSLRHIILRSGVATQEFPDYDMLVGHRILDASEGPLFFFTRFLTFVYFKVNNWTISSSRFIVNCCYDVYWDEIESLTDTKEDRFSLIDILGGMINLLCQNIQDRYLQPIIYLTSKLVIIPIVSAWPKASDNVKMVYLFTGSSLIYIIPPILLIADKLLGGVWTFRRLASRLFWLYLVWLFALFFFYSEPLLSASVKLILELLIEPCVDFFQTKTFALNMHLRVQKTIIHALRLYILWFLGFTIAGRFFELWLYHKVPRLAKVALAFIVINYIFLDPGIFQLSPDKDWNSIIVTWAHDFYYAYVYFGFFHYLISIKMLHWTIWYTICLWLSIAANWPKRSLRRLTDVDEAHRRIRLRVQQFPRAFYILLFMALFAGQLKQLSGDFLIPELPDKLAIEAHTYLYQYYPTFDPLRNAPYSEPCPEMHQPPKALMHMYMKDWWVDWWPSLENSAKLGTCGFELRGWQEYSVFPDPVQVESWMDHPFKGPRFNKAVWGLSDLYAIGHPRSRQGLAFLEHYANMCIRYERAQDPVEIQRAAEYAAQLEAEREAARKQAEYEAWRASQYEKQTIDPRLIWRDLKQVYSFFNWVFCWFFVEPPTPELTWEEHWEDWEDYLEWNLYRPLLYSEYLIGHNHWHSIGLDFRTGGEHLLVTDHLRTSRFYKVLPRKDFPHEPFLPKALPLELLSNKVETPAVFWELPLVLTSYFPQPYSRLDTLSDAEFLLKTKPVLSYYNLWYLQESTLLISHSPHFFVTKGFVNDVDYTLWWIRFCEVGPLQEAWNHAWPHLRIYMQIFMFFLLVIPVGLTKIVMALIYLGTLLYDVIFHWDKGAPHHLCYVVELYYWIEIKFIRPENRQAEYPFYLQDIYNVIGRSTMPVWIWLHKLFPGEK